MVRDAKEAETHWKAENNGVSSSNFFLCGFYYADEFLLKAIAASTFAQSYFRMDDSLLLARTEEDVVSFFKRKDIKGVLQILQNGEEKCVAGPPSFDCGCHFTCAEVALAAPAHFKLPTFPCSNSFCHNL
ncbi:hypothetical protein TNCV_4378201 [Trichonephila clavipes]|nr:hypothetical protein TNCV_4378201 [Trichonephila clavipes]